jgi:hypothetical protein
LETISDAEKRQIKRTKGRILTVFKLGDLTVRGKGLDHFWNIGVDPFAVTLQAIGALDILKRYSEPAFLRSARPAANWASICLIHFSASFPEFICVSKSPTNTEQDA